MIYAIARARTTTPLAYVLLRVHKKKLVRSSAAPQTMGRTRGRLGEKGGMKGTTVWREEARDDRDANSFCSLPRLLRPFLRMQIVGGRRRPLECVSRSEGVRAREGERIKVRARAKDYEYSSFTISGGSRLHTGANSRTPFAKSPLDSTFDRGRRKGARIERKIYLKSSKVLWWDLCKVICQVYKYGISLTHSRLPTELSCELKKLIFFPFYIFFFKL